MKGHRFLRVVDTHKHPKSAEKDFSRGSLNVSLHICHYLNFSDNYLHTLLSQLVKISDVLRYLENDVFCHLASFIFALGMTRVYMQSKHRWQVFLKLVWSDK